MAWAALLYLGLSLGHVERLEAATKSWSAPAFGGDRRWSVAANWGGSTPVNGDNLVFNQKSDSSFQDDCTNNLSSLQLGNILFNGTVNAVPDIWGNGITLSGGISEGVSFWGAKVGTPVTLAAGQAFESVLDGHLDLTNVNVGVHTLTLSTRLSSSRINMRGRISGSGQIVIEGPGSVDFRAPLTNTFSGPVQVRNSSRLTLGAIAGGAGLPSIVGDLIVGDGSTEGSVTIVADHQIDGDITVNPGSDIFLGATDAWPSLTLNDATVLISGTELLQLSGPVTVGGTTNSTVRGPVSLGSASRNFVVGDGVELRLAGPLAGVNLSLNRPGVIKSGLGTLLLLSNNTFGGNVSIAAGRVIAAEPLSLGAPTSEALGIVSGSTSVAEGGELLLSAVSVTNELLTLTTTTGGLSSTGACVWAGVISLQAAVPFNISNSSCTVLGPVVGPGGIVKRGVGTLTLTGTNGFTGLTRHEAGLLLLNKPGNGVALTGDLQVGDGLGGANADIVRVQQAEQIADTAAVTVTSSGQLDLNAAETIGALRGSGMVRLDGGDLTLGGSGSDEALSAAIAGTFGLVKIGTGVQTLSGANSYTGPTRVLAGVLRVDGVQSASAIQLIGATLEGRGTVGAITGNGRIAPGTSGGAGRLSCGNLAYQAGASLALDLGGVTAGVLSDQLAVQGTVQLANASLVLNLLPGYAPDSGDTLIVLENDGVDAIAGTFAGVAQNGFVSVGPGRRFRVRYDGGDGNDVSLTYTNETLAPAALGLALGNGNGRLDPNECARLTGGVVNQTGQTLENVTVELQPLSAGIFLSEPIIHFASVGPNASAPWPPVGISVAPEVPCGSLVTIAVVLRQDGAFVSSTPFNLTIGAGGAGGCADGGGICTYCADVVIAGSLRAGDATQTGTLAASGRASVCGVETACPGSGGTGSRLVDVLTFQNGARAACLTVALENVCPAGGADLWATVYTGSFSPANLCARYRADVGNSVAAGRSGQFSFQARADEVFVVTVNEAKAGQGCADYRLTVSGGDCRPRLAIQNVANTNIVRVSWPNSAPFWRPQAAGQLNFWSDLAVTPTNSGGRFYFDSRTSGSSRFFRLREP